LLEEGVFTHPNSIRFAGIMDGEIVGQYGKRKDTFENQEKIDEYVNIIISSEIVELTSEQLSFVEVGWLYDGSNFTNPD
jgi:hypothetical protein